MTRITPQEAKRLGLWERSVPFPEPRKPRHKGIHTTKPPIESQRVTQAHTGAISGLFGTTLHRWLFTRRVDSYISVCQRVQRHNRPQGTSTSKCEVCYQEEVG